MVVNEPLPRLRCVFLQDKLLTEKNVVVKPNGLCTADRISAARVSTRTQEGSLYTLDLLWHRIDGRWWWAFCTSESFVPCWPSTSPGTRRLDCPCRRMSFWKPNTTVWLTLDDWENDLRFVSRGLEGEETQHLPVRCEVLGRPADGIKWLDYHNIIFQSSVWRVAFVVVVVRSQRCYCCRIVNFELFKRVIWRQTFDNILFDSTWTVFFKDQIKLMIYVKQIKSVITVIRLSVCRPTCSRLRSQDVRFYHRISAIRELR